jgi:saccharopine dehydrogenase-like NADP-dependent oxidoreductase
MKKILIIGAGKSSATLIKYLIENAEREQWKITIVDQDKNTILDKTAGSEFTVALESNILEEEIRRKLISENDVVISMLPARFHMPLIEDCVMLKTDIVTPSYETPEIKALNDAAVENDMLIMNEIGLDPGIDHMSAKRIIDNVNAKGGELTYFESFTGGLVAPESDDNPWNYKFTWNPRNVVLAGQGSAAKFIQRGRYKYIPYNRLFRRTEVIDIEGYGKFEGYANRDSLKYRKIYGLDNIPTIYRGTLRRVGFSRAWNTLVQVGATDDSYIMEGSANMTHRDFINSFLAYNPWDSVELKFRYYMKIDQDDIIWEKLEWLGLFDRTPIGLGKDSTPAQILQRIMEKKLSLRPDDKDMIVMYHKIGYKLDGIDKEINSSLVVIGEDQTYTAMSDTVGLPLGIFVKHLLRGDIKCKGVRLPLSAEVYNPVLDELAEYGMSFKEREFIPTEREVKLQ